MPLKFYYWNAKGWAEPARQLLHYLKIDYEETTWEDFPGWFAKRDEIFVDPIKSPFPDFPILIDGDFVLSEQETIHYYLCKKFGRPDLYGKTLQDQVRVRQINALLTKMLTKVIFQVVLSPDHKTNITEFLKEGGEINEYIKSLAGFLDDKNFLLGYLTISDFRTAYQLRHVRNTALSNGLEDPIVGKHENLVALIKRVAALPELAGFAGGPKDYPFEPVAFAPWFKDHPLQ